MLVFLEKFKDFLKILLTYGSPILIVLFILAVIVGILRWTRKTKENLKEISENPILLIFWIITSIIVITLFFVYVYPLIANVLEFLNE